MYMFLGIFIRTVYIVTFGQSLDVRNINLLPTSARRHEFFDGTGLGSVKKTHAFEALSIASPRKVYNESVTKAEKKTKFNFEELKTAATSENAGVRKKSFEEYFEQFEEFPSYLFDNTDSIDTKLSETIKDIENDPETSARMRKGIAQMLNRLPARQEGV